MSLLIYFLALTTPLAALVTELISWPILIQQSSNQSFFNELVIVVFLASVLGVLGMLLSGWILARISGEKNSYLSLLPLYLAWETPFFAFAAGFISSLIFIRLISNQWPSEGLVIVVFLATLLGTLGGGLIGYVLCPQKEQPGGWAWNCLPCIFISFGQWLGATIIPLLTSYLLATTQQWVNNPWPSNEQIFLIFLLILVAVIVGWLTLLQELDMGNES